CFQPAILGGAGNEADLRRGGRDARETLLLQARRRSRGRRRLVVAYAATGPEECEQDNDSDPARHAATVTAPRDVPILGNRGGGALCTRSRGRGHRVCSSQSGKR